MRAYYLHSGIKYFKHYTPWHVQTRAYTCATKITRHSADVEHVSYGDYQSGHKKDVSAPLPQGYKPQYVEEAWYDWWEKQGFFSPKSAHTNADEEPFVMVLPPPNVTGTLHLGHALTCAIQDALVRWHRMHGRQALWVPGCDHAGIATQVVVERRLWKDHKKTRHDIGRKQFVKEVWKWKTEKGGLIYDQMKKLGCSLDWSREAFTMNERLSQAVNEAFVRLHDEGLIYRSNRLVNWSCSLNSAISDIEVLNVPVEGRTEIAVPGYNKKVTFGILSSFAYPVENTNEEVVVATTRLETMLGDVAVAIHPADERYVHLHGQFVLHPIDGRRLPIICDDFVDQQFGTGAVKITPAHDYTDYEVGLRHQLSPLSVIDDGGDMTNVDSAFCGKKRFLVRHLLQKALKEKNVFRGEEEHSLTVPVCSRSGDIVEPRLKDQWFVSCNKMAEQAAQAVTDGKLTLLPNNHTKIWLDWLNNIRDWCISRQLWWGHQIPAYRVLNIQDKVVWVSGRTQEEAVNKAADTLGIPASQVELQQDEDVLDTWFSSALFPFSVLGWPNKTKDLAKFYPTSLLETGSDIIFFWVARMVMMGLKLTGELPFDKVLLHGLLRDAHGRKMSKSLGNVIDPMDVIHGISLEELQAKLTASDLDRAEIRKAKEGQRRDFPQGIPQCGADALRFTLCSYDFKAGEVNMDIVQVKSHRHFCNKVWQAFKFVTANLGDGFQYSGVCHLNGSESQVDLWILSRLSRMVSACDTHFKSFDLQFVTKALHQFWVSEFCDVYLECVKPVFQTGSVEEQDCCRQVLYTCTESFLRALSPFMPYLTEELYQRLPAKGDNWPVSVCVSSYPTSVDTPWRDERVEEEMILVEFISNRVLSVRKLFNMTKAKPDVIVKVDDDVQAESLSAYRLPLQTLSRAGSLSVTTDSDHVPQTGCVQVDVEGQCQLFVVIEGLVDPAKDIERLTRTRTSVQEELSKAASLKMQSDGTQTNKWLSKEQSLQRDIKRLEHVISVLGEMNKRPQV
ncbi:valine--tRNA ligase-like [Gigantopelta aegis]|uniref:valine--tRNA ligase-like n=1 Tax=Gigantopelta aegis TaxID=1735272 RepID=UPI001B8899A3|nr:valine--tRNA ligase-like [Gigantopelta aegis]